MFIEFSIMVRTPKQIDKTKFYGNYVGRNNDGLDLKKQKIRIKCGFGGPKFYKQKQDEKVETHANFHLKGSEN